MVFLFNFFLFFFFFSFSFSLLGNCVWYYINETVFLSVSFKALFRADWANPSLGKAIAFDCGCRNHTEVRAGEAVRKVPWPRPVLRPLHCHPPNRRHLKTWERGNKRLGSNLTCQNEMDLPSLELVEWIKCSVRMALRDFGFLYLNSRGSVYDRGSETWLSMSDGFR